MSDTSIRSFVATEDPRAYAETLAGPKWLRDLRMEAATRFESTGWPTTSEEEWRRTSLRAFEFDSYKVGGAAGDESDAGTLAQETPSAAGRLVFGNNDVVSVELGQDHAERGVFLGALSALGGDGGKADDRKADIAGKVRDTLKESAELSDNRLGHWHHALLADVAVLYVPRFVEIAEPFVIDFRLSGEETVRTPHVVVILEEGARATVVKRLLSAGDGETLVVDADDLMVGPAAGLKFTVLQRLNDESLVFGNSRGRVQADAELHRTEAVLGADFVKTRFVTDIAGKGADVVLNGLYFASDEQHIDMRTVQAHNAARTGSRAFYRGAVLDQSHSIYQGLISVDAEARGTDAFLTNKNLILSDEARADSIPSLNINTDDVKCSHGSTTGKLDRGQVFYLQTRGYNEHEARLTLIQGYFEDLVEQTPELVQDEIRGLIADRLADRV